MQRRLAASALVTTVLAVAPWGAAHAQVATEDGALVPTFSGASGRFGSAVALEGERLVVGAPESSIFGGAVGLIEVFERDTGGAWQSQAVLIPTIAQSLARFGFGVQLSGNIVAGAYSTVPRVDIFERDTNGAYSHLQSIDRPDLTFLGFGRSIGLAGDRLVVATSSSGGFGFGPGAVSIYQRIGGGPFGLVTSVFVPPSTITTPQQSFGTSLGLSGDVVAVGDPRAVVTGRSSAGRVVVFERDAGSGTWSALQTITAPAVAVDEYFGWAVALEGDRLVIGSPGAASAAGRVDVYERSGAGPFSHMATLTDVAPLAGEGFGSTLALRGERLAVGVPGDDATGPNTGAIALFERTSGGLFAPYVRLGRDGADANDALGNGGPAVALSDERLVVGAQTLARFTGGALAYELGTLYRGTPTLSLAAGGVQALLLRAGELRGGDAFVLLGSLTGTSPGIVLAPGVVLPLIFDAYTNLGLSYSTPAQPGLGLLDPLGHADAAFTLPAASNASFAGLSVHHAYVTIDLTTFEAGASNAVRVDLVP